MLISSFFYKYRKSNWKCAYQMFDIFAADQITIIKYLYLNHFIGFV